MSLFQDWDEKLIFRVFGNFGLNRARINVKKEMRKVESQLKKLKKGSKDHRSLTKDKNKLQNLHVHLLKLEQAEDKLQSRAIQFEGRMEEDIQTEIDILHRFGQRGFPRAFLQENAAELVVILTKLSKDLQKDMQHFANLKRKSDTLLEQARKAS